MQDQPLPELPRISPVRIHDSGRGSLISMLFKNWAPLAVITMVMVWPVTRHLFSNLPSAARFVPDLVIGWVTVIAIVRVISNRSWSDIPPSQILLFLAFLYVTISGIVLNNVSGDTVFAGVRIYFKYVPVFLIPFAFRFNREDYRFQLLFIVALLLLQIPATVWERFVLYRHLFTGDYITGTLISTSSLSVISAAAITFIVAFSLTKMIKLSTAVVLGVLFLFPASLAETKATPIFLAVGLATLLFARRKHIDLKKMIGIGLSSIVLLGGFIVVYDQLYSREDGAGYLDLMTDSDRMLSGYNMKGVETMPFSIPIRERNDLVAKEKPVISGDAAELGRIDSISQPFYALFPHEMSYLLLGLGIGNMDSQFGSGGDYQAIEHYLHGSHVTLSHMLWEVGVLGALFFIIFIASLLVRCYRISTRTTGWLQSMATALSALSAIVLLCLIYANLLHLPEVLVVYLYLAGVVLSEAKREERRGAADFLVKNTT